MNVVSKPGGFRGGVHTSQTHDSAAKHVAGTAFYVDDVGETPGTLQAALVTSPIAHGRIKAIDASAALALPGVVAVITAADIPGQNDVSPILPGDKLFADGVVEHHGQPVAAIAARSLDIARAAAKLVVLDLEPLPPILTVREAMAAKSFLVPPMVVETGEPEAALAGARHRIAGHFEIGGQEHFYLEGQVAVATPGEDGDVTILASTQNPTEIQQIVARLLGCDFNRLTVVTRRLGGGLRRQGEQFLLGGGRRHAAGAENRQAGEASAAARDGYDRHRQAPWLCHRLRGRVRR